MSRAIWPQILKFSKSSPRKLPVEGNCLKGELRFSPLYDVPSLSLINMTNIAI